jgi:cadmium resistance protein CadD (predicted permease)
VKVVNTDSAHEMTRATKILFPLAMCCEAILFLTLFYLPFFTQCPVVGKFIGDNANYLVPFILIGLGLFILHDSIIWK